MAKKRKRPKPRIPSEAALAARALAAEQAAATAKAKRRMLTSRIFLIIAVVAAVVAFVVGFVNPPEILIGPVAVLLTMATGVHLLIRNRTRNAGVAVRGAPVGDMVIAIGVIALPSATIAGIGHGMGGDRGSYLNALGALTAFLPLVTLPIGTMLVFTLLILPRRIARSDGKRTAALVTTLFAAVYLFLITAGINGTVEDPPVVFGLPGMIIFGAVAAICVVQLVAGKQKALGTDEPPAGKKERDHDEAGHRHG